MQRAVHRAGRDARRARRRPARPHVRARRAAHGLSHGGARPRRRPARPGCVAHEHIRAAYLDAAGARSPRRALRRDHDRVRERAGRRAGDAGASAARSRRRRRRSRSARTATPRRRLRAQRRRLRAACGRSRARATARAAVADALLPGILKTARLGYDGKGQRARSPTRAELAQAWAALGGVRLRAREAPAARRRDAASIVARGARRRDRPPAGAARTCTATASSPSPRVPARPRSPPTRRPRRSRCAARSPTALDYVGVLCVEFFVLADGSLVANEMAPRPHNSGHYSIDACDVSQFELQVRAMTGAPLVAPRLHSPCVMLNLLGDLWFARRARRARLGARCSALPGAHLHLYGKDERAPGPQDGPPHAHRGDRRRGRGACRGGAAGRARPARPRRAWPGGAAMRLDGRRRRRDRRRPPR